MIRELLVGVAAGVSLACADGEPKQVPEQSLVRPRDAIDLTKSPVESQRVYFQFEVDTPVTPRLGQPAPKYPEKLRALGIEGNVLARFVVDSSGRADTSTFRVVSESDPRFTRSVKEALIRIHYEPAILHDRSVRQLVEQRFDFRLDQ